MPYENQPFDLAARIGGVGIGLRGGAFRILWWQFVGKDDRNLPYHVRQRNPLFLSFLDVVEGHSLELICCRIFQFEALMIGGGGGLNFVQPRPYG